MPTMATTSNRDYEWARRTVALLVRKLAALARLGKLL